MSPGTPRVVISVREFAPEVIAAIGPASRRAYLAGVKRLVTDYGDRDLGTIRLADLRATRQAVIRESGQRTVERAREKGRRLRSYDPDAHGQGAGENFVRATRFFFRLAVAAELIDKSPADELEAPRRRAAPERPLTSEELGAIWEVVTGTGDDPELDGLLILFIRHTAARREGCLNLAVDHLDRRRSSVTLTEKYGNARELPLGSDLLTTLADFAAARGARKDGDAVFRYRDGRPMGRRRFDMIFDRVDRHLGWTQPLDIGAHWIRHTTLADIAAVSDVRVAAAYAGHSLDSLGVIGRYTKVTFEDLQAAYHALFGHD